MYGPRFIISPIKNGGQGESTAYNLLMTFQETNKKKKRRRRSLQSLPSVAVLVPEKKWV